MKEPLRKINEVIGVFMGGKKVLVCDDPLLDDEYWIISFDKGGCIYLDEEEDYYHDWKRLMPVVEKIESLTTPTGGKYGVYISRNVCWIKDSEFMKIHTRDCYFDSETSDDKIAATLEVVYRFILNYNEGITYHKGFIS